jgi:glycosyltransferase involved in cell wall biosynthesis
VNESNAGIAVAAGNFKELAEAIGMMMELDAIKLEKMGHAAKLYSERNFNRRHLIDRIERQLESLKIVG